MERLDYKVYSTGSSALDNLFGGYKTRTLIEFFGLTEAGKTTLGVYIPIMSIWKDMQSNDGEDGQFLVIDCDESFDEERFEQILVNNNIDPEPVFERIILFRPTGFGEQHKIITKEIPEIIKNGIVPKFITIDAICSHYRGAILRSPGRFKLAEIGEKTGKLDMQLNYIRGIAHKYNCPSTVVTWEGSNLEIGETQNQKDGNKVASDLGTIGGRAMQFLPKVVVHLKMVTKLSPLREAVLVKHRSKPVGQTARFTLCDGGIKDVVASGR